MKIPSVAQAVRGLGTDSTVRFVRLRDEQLWYTLTYQDLTTNVAWEFRVPLADTGGATFLAEDKPLFFMRWIRQHIAEQIATKEQERQDQCKETP